MSTDQDHTNTTAYGHHIVRLLSEQVAALLDPAASKPRPDAADLTRMLRQNREPICVADDYEIQDPVVLRSCDFDHRIELRGVIFREVVDLSDARLHKTVDFTGCTFLRGLALEGARVEGSLLLCGATFGPLDQDELERGARLSLVRVGGNLLARGVRVQGGLDLLRAEVRGGVDLSSTPDRQTIVRGALRLNRARVEGAVRLNGVRILDDVDAEGMETGAFLSLDPLRSDHERGTGAVLHRSSVGGSVVMANADIRGELHLTGIRIRQDVNLQAAKVRGGVFCRCEGGLRPVVGGQFYSPYASFSTTADFSGAAFGRGMFMEGSVVAGTLFLNRCDGEGASAPPGPGAWSTFSRGAVRLSSAKITGNLEAVGARIAGNLELDAVDVTGFVGLASVQLAGELQLDSATMKGLYIRHEEGMAAKIAADLRAPGCCVDSGLDFSGLHVGGQGDFSGAKITGDVVLLPMKVLDQELAEPTTFAGGLAFHDAVITGRLAAAGLHCGGVLSLARAEVKGDVDLSEARVHLPGPARPGRPAPGVTPRQGALNGIGVRIRGRFQGNGAVIGGALNLQNSWIGGGLYCGTVPSEEGADETAGMFVAGPVLLDGAEVLKQADFRGADVRGELSLERVRLEGRFRCPLSVPAGGDRPLTCLTSIDLRSLRVRHLDLAHDERGEPGKPTGIPVRLEGCSFRELSVPGDDYTTLFAAQEVGFTQSAYVAVERWLRDRGYDARAESVYRLMLLQRRKHMRLRDRVADRAVEALRRGASQFQMLIALAVLTFILSVALFSLPGGLERGKDAAEVPGSGGGGAALPAPRPTLVDAALTAAKVHLPMLDFPGDGDWRPARAAVTVEGQSLWVRYDVYGVCISLLSYAVVPLIITGIATTWLRRGGRSG